MNCEMCGVIIIEKYGSGRFCNKQCACAFSTKNKRAEINEAVRQKLKGRAVSTSHLQTEEVREKRNKTMIEKYGTISFQHHDFSQEKKEAIKQKVSETRRKQRHSRPFQDCSHNLKKKILIEELGHQCSKCNLSEWLGEKIPLELDHIDGDHSNKEKSNFRLLCANCHSLTPTFRRRKTISKAPVAQQQRQCA